jgi:hypothetical protein
MRKLIAAGAVAASLVACGGSKSPPPPAAAPAGAAPGTGPAPTTATAPAAKTAAPVQAEALAALLPDVAGWSRSSMRSERVANPVPYSKAEAHYEKGESTIELVITDSGFQPLVLEPIAMFIGPGYDERSGGTHRKAVTVAGSPGSETWTPGSRRGEVTVLVTKRFIVTGTGLDVGNLDGVRAAVRAVNFGRLAALK